MSRPDWDTYFLDIAMAVAKRSTCRRVPEGVGAVLVRDKRILSTGYVGSLKGQPHCTEVGCMIDEFTKGCRRTTHSEINCILQAASHGVCIKDSTLYSTMSPCWDCFKALANGGVERIVYLTEYRTVLDQKQFAKACGIAFEHVGTAMYRGIEQPSITERKI